MEDQSALTDLANNTRISDMMTDAFPSPYTADDAMAFIQRVSAPQVPNILAITWKGEIAGSIGVFPLQDINRLNAEIGYWLGEPFWSKGIMTEVLKAMCNYAFFYFPVTRLFARPYPHNTASIRVLEKAGFILEAQIKDALIKKGVVIDELIYALRKVEQ